MTEEVDAMGDSTKSRRRKKPVKKPYDGFPLTAHPTGRWCKKIRGKLHYFGRWGTRQNGEVTTVDNFDEEAQAAVDLYNEQRDDLHAGRTPRVKSDGLTVAEACNRFLNAKHALLDTGELTQRSFGNYLSTCQKITAAFGRNRLVNDLAVEDFDGFRRELAKGRGPVALGNEIRHVRIVFKYAYDAGLIDRPLRFGPHFKGPSKAILRRERAKNGKRMFEADEFRRILDAADSVLKAMILLGINCGFGQTDCANLRQTHLDLDGGWIDYPRPKTGIERRCPIWPETIEALREAIDLRPEPKDPGDDELCFVTIQGNRWVRPLKMSHVDTVGPAFKRLLVKLGIDGKRNFYAIRHTFETIAGESKDQVAVNSIMGHVDNSMAGVYRERISDERLKAVVDVVRSWLLPELDGDNDRK
jgi:integrase